MVEVATQRAHSSLPVVCLRGVCQHSAWRWRLLLADDAFGLPGAEALEVEGQPSCGEAIQKNTQGVDVARRSRSLQAELLRRGVLRRKGVHHGRRLAAAVAGETGDAEVEQFDALFVGDQDVRGLDVPVRHELGVSRLHRLAHLKKEAETSFEREAVPLAEVVDRKTVDKLHHEVGRAVFRNATIDESRDRGVVEASQDLTFAQESPARLRRCRAVGKELDGHLLFVLIVGTLGEIDGSHTASTDLSLQAVGSEPLARDGNRGVSGQRSALRGEELEKLRRIVHQTLGHRAGLGKTFEQRPDLATDLIGLVLECSLDPFP
ncbi:MAG: hypothetical protein AAF690_17940 [Acidobacteriota bacterium]